MACQRRTSRRFWGGHLSIESSVGWGTVVRVVLPPFASTAEMPATQPVGLVGAARAVA